MYLSGSVVTSSIQQLPYRAYVENFLIFSTQAKNSQLFHILWYRYTSGQFDTHDEACIDSTKRKELAAESKKIDMYGRLHLNLTFQNRYLLNGVKVVLGFLLLARKHESSNK